MMLDNRQRCARAARHVRSPRPPARHTHTHTYNFPVDHPFLPLQMLHLWGTVVVWRRLQRWLSLRAAAITIVPTTVTTPANEPVQTRGATALHTRLFLLSLTPSPPHCLLRHGCSTSSTVSCLLTRFLVALGRTENNRRPRRRRWPGLARRTRFGRRWTTSGPPGWRRRTATFF